MNHILKKLGAAAAFALFGAAGALAGSPSSASMSVGSSPSDISSAESGSRALLDTLVKKGVITDQEAEEIGVKMTEDEVTSPNVKFEQSLGIKKLMFFGDVRIREEVRNGVSPQGALYPGSTTAQASKQSETRDRFRYRLRFGFKADLVDDWFAGFRFATNSGNPRSGNVTFGDTGSNGPFGKGKSALSVDQVYLGWKGADWFTFEIGQMANPLYSRNMVWDPNFNVAGISEQLHHQFGDNLMVFGNFIQALYADSPRDNEDSTPSVANSFNQNDVYMFIEQVGLQYNIKKDMYVKIAPELMTYSGTRSENSGDYAAGTANGGAPNGFAGPFNGDISDGTTYNGIAGNNYGINDLMVVDVPMEFDFKAAKIPWKLFGDFAINADADERASQAGHAGRGGEDGYAWQAGLQANAAKKKGDWQATAYWQRTGTYALDPNLVDADIFDGRTNMEGVVLSGTYNFTDAISGTVSYANGNRIDKSVGTDGLAMGTPGTAQDLNLTAINHYQLVQFDLNWKF